MVINVISLWVLCVALSKVSGEVQRRPRIAIIGGGIGGASSAYHLSELFGDGVHIDVYEADTVGGRLATTIIGEKEYETGGSVIHPDNRLTRHYAEILNLTRLVYQDDGGWGLYDGTKMLFSPSKNSIIKYAQLLWRYGTTLWKLNQLGAKILENFLLVYDCLSSGAPLFNVEEISPDKEIYKVSIKNYLKDRGVGDLIVEELAAAATLVNYGQKTSVQGFVGLTSLLASGDLWSVKGGNRLIPEGLLRLSKATLTRGFVDEIRLSNEGYFLLTYLENPDFRLIEEGKSHDSGKVEVTCRGPCVNRTAEYDYVIIATSLTWDKSGVIKMVEFPDPIKIQGQYHRTTATMVQGRLNDTYFSGEVTDEMFFIRNSPLINSISRVVPVDGTSDNGSPVFKIFSQKPIPEDLLDEIFSERSVTQVFDWLAYPNYPREFTGASFVLHPKLYYLNNVEWLASAMEMSALAGQNLANIIYNDFNGIHQQGCNNTASLERSDL